VLYQFEFECLSLTKKTIIIMILDHSKKNAITPMTTIANVPSHIHIGKKRSWTLE